MIQAVIFDMDGLLIDSEPFWQQAETEVFATVGIHLTKELCAETVGFRPDAMVSHWYKKFPWSNKSLKQVETEITYRVKELIQWQAQPKEGVLQVLSFFEEKHLPMAIASSSPYLLIHQVVKKLDLSKQIQTLHSAEEEPFGKPHPGTYMTAAAKLGISPENGLAFEDSFYGMLSAKSARMKVVGVPEISHFPQTRYDFCDLKLKSLREFNHERFLQVNQ